MFLQLLGLFLQKFMVIFKLSNSHLSHKGTRHINRRQFKLLQMDVGHIIIGHSVLIMSE